MSTYKHLSYEQRCHIYQLKKIDWAVKDIAAELNVHKSTVYRELRRNTGEKGYRYKQAQKKS